MNPIETHDLRVFLSVAKHLSFSKAAEELHLTQPAISKRIMSLEKQLGKPLFERFKRKVLLSEAGEMLLPNAKSILTKLEDTENLISGLGQVVTGKLAIAFSHHVGLHRLPPYLKRFKESYPGVTLDIQFIDSDAGYQKILDAEVELAVITLKSELLEDIQTTKLWTDPLVFVCSHNHELHLKDNVTLEDLSHIDAILTSPETETRRILDRLFREQQLSPNASMNTNYLETIKTMVSIGLGWSILPKTMTEDLEIMHVPDTYLERSLGLIQHKERTLSRAAKAFAELLCSPKQL